MKKVILSLVGVIFGLCLSVSTAFADNLKVGVIDLQQILQKSPQLAAINNQLTKQFKPRQDKLIAAQKNLQDEVNRLNRDSAVMSAADRDKLQQQIITDRAQVDSMTIGFKNDLSAAQNQGMQNFMGQLSKAVDSVAKAGNYDLILQRAGVPYVKDGLDVTAQVLTALNKK